MFVPLIIITLWIGLYPKPWFQILEQPVGQIVQTIHDNSSANAPVSAQTAPQPLPCAPGTVGQNGVDGRGSLTDPRQLGRGAARALKPALFPAFNGAAKAVPDSKPIYEASAKAVVTKASH
jgi:hypothetical protein